MSIHHGEDIAYESPRGPIRAYLASSSEGGPGLILVQEVFGMTDHLREVARRFAAEGFVTLVPDLYTGDEVRPTLRVADIENAIRAQLADDPEKVLSALAKPQADAARRAIAWRAGLMARNTYLPDLRAGIDYLRSAEPTSGQVGAVGWCLGGAVLGRLVVSGADLQAAVIYYGAPPPLEDLSAVRTPLLGNYGGTDHAITSKIPAMKAAFDDAGLDFEYHVYEDAGHAFNNDHRSSYHRPSAELAMGRTLDFLRDHLVADRV